MSVLLDLTTEAGFNQATYRLLQSLKSEKNLTLQSLRSHTAKALGARSLGALQAQLRQQDKARAEVVFEQPADEADDGMAVYRKYWEKAKSRWAVVTCMIPNARNDGFVRVVLNGDLRVQAEMKALGELPASLSLPTPDWVTDIPPSSLFYGFITNEVVLVDIDDKREWLLPEDAQEGSLQIMLLNEYCPELFTVLMAGEDDMEDVLFDSREPQVELARALGFTQEAYHEEYDNGDTKLEYSAWVAHQVDSWVDDVAAHLS